MMRDRRGESDGVTDQTSDRELVRRILSCGDMDAKNVLYQRYQVEVLRVVAGESQNPLRDDVEDIAQEAWLVILHPDRLSQWRGIPPSLRPWIRTIARNKVADHYRRVREVLWCPDGDDFLLADDAPDPEAEALRRLAEARLAEAILRCCCDLTDVEYLAFDTWREGGSLADLARELGKQPNAVHQDADRARRKVFSRLLRHYRHLLPEELAGEALGRKWGKR